MTDTVQSIAFDAAAPAHERQDAQREIQKSYAPKSAGDLLPMDAVADMVEGVRASFEETAFLKAINPQVVPFPSERSKSGKPGMQSVLVDDWSISIQGDYWEKPGMLSFQSMRTMVDQTPVLNAVMLTRIRQVQRFCQIAESGDDMPGFEIRHADRHHQVTESERESIQLLNRFMVNCGWEFSPRKRKRLRRDSLSQFMAKAVRDSLTMDSCAIETEMKRDRNLGIDGFYSVDGATIRLCSENGYRGDDELFAIQVVDSRISTAYTYDDLIYEARNPRSDVRVCGYGLSETELMIRVVTGFLNAMTYNIKGFDSNSIPKGMLHLTGNYDDKDMAAFRRYWNAMVKGVNNAWSLPVMVSKDQESKASFERFGVDFNEMHFSKWMTFLTSIICAIYGMSPAEINFDSFSGGNTSPLSGGDTAEKLAASKDSGLRPLLSYFQSLFTDFIIGDFSDKYVFRWTGLDPEDAARKFERAKLTLTVNEMRAEDGRDALPGPMGDAPVNPSLVGVWSQMQQAGQAEQGGEDQGGEDEEEDYGQAPDDAESAGDDAGADSEGAAAEQGAPGEGDEQGQVGKDFGKDGAGDFGRRQRDFGKQAGGDFGKSFGLPVLSLEDF